MAITRTPRDRSKCMGVLPMFSGAAIMGVLQAILVILLLSTTGVLLNRWHAWRSEYEVNRVVDTSNTTPNGSTITTNFPGQFATLTTTGQVAHPAALAVWPEDGKWYRDSALSAFLEIHLTHHVALYCFWLICLFIFALAFRYRRPALVIPNLVMQVVGLILMMILIGIVIAKLVLLNSEYNSIVSPPNRGINEYPAPTFSRDDINMRYAFYAILLGVLVICLIAQFVFVWITIEFYQYLRDTEHALYPDDLHHDGRAAYHHHVEEHRILRDEEDPKHQRATHLITNTTVEPNARLYHEPAAPISTKVYTRGDQIP